MSRIRMKLIRWLERHKRTISIERERRIGKEALSDPQWIWKSLVGSMATWGSSRGHERLSQEGDCVWDKIGFDALLKVSRSEAVERLKRVMRRVNPRYATNKATYLGKNLAIIAEMGGPSSVRDLALKCPNADAKIKFLMQFHGIGPKYARNIWMYVLDKDVIDHIALDARLKKVARALYLDVSTYPKAEESFRRLAVEANLNMYQLDRLLYRGMARDGELFSLIDGKENEKMRKREVRRKTRTRRTNQSKAGTDPNRTVELLAELSRTVN